MFRRVVKHHAKQECPRRLDAKNIVEALAEVGIEIVQCEFKGPASNGTYLSHK